MHRILALLLIGAVATALTACGTTTSIVMTKQIDVLDHLTSRGLLTTTGHTVTGFRVGTTLPLPPFTTTASSRAETTVLPEAGSEVEGFCPGDGDGHDLTLTGNAVTSVTVIGDTGNDDVSSDDDCHCDTQVKELLIDNLDIEATPPIPFGFSNVTFGRDVLCPNRHAAHTSHSGGLDFGGAVVVNFAAILSVVDGRLLLDVTYAVREP